MDNELKKQQIKSLIEQSGYVDMERTESRLWKWLAGIAIALFFSYLAFDLIVR